MIDPLLRDWAENSPEPDRIAGCELKQLDESPCEAQTQWGSGIERLADLGGRQLLAGRVDSGEEDVDIGFIRMSDGVGRTVFSGLLAKRLQRVLVGGKSLAQKGFEHPGELVVGDCRKSA